jgi:hypothetical protein
MLVLIFIASSSNASLFHQMRLGSSSRPRRQARRGVQRNVNGGDSGRVRGAGLGAPLDLHCFALAAKQMPPGEPFPGAPFPTPRILPVPSASLG